jgi:hypothetical protein
MDMRKKRMLQTHKKVAIFRAGSVALQRRWRSLCYWATYFQYYSIKGVFNSVTIHTVCLQFRNDVRYYDKQSPDK